MMIAAGLTDHLHELEAVEDRHCPIGDDDVGNVVREGFKAGCTILGLTDFAGAEPMQQVRNMRRICALSSMTRKRKRLKSMRTMAPRLRAHLEPDTTA
jgi:hypothetical protein